MNMDYSHSDEEIKNRAPRRSLLELRTPRQKFCLRWQEQFPWLRPNRINESVGYCTICCRELVCKKSHLERHQKSFRHIRLGGFENISTVNIETEHVDGINVTEVELVDSRTTDYIDVKTDLLDESHVVEYNDEYTTIEVEPIAVPQFEYVDSVEGRKNDVEMQKTCTESLATIENIGYKRKNLNISPQAQRYPHGSGIPRVNERESSEFYYISKAPPQVAAMPQSKDSFDLFFESVSATVKSMPPKLGAEVKSQVSQLIANFELRAIYEKEAHEKAAAAEPVGVSPANKVIAVKSTIKSMPSSNALLPALQQSEPESDQAIAHYVYSFQPK